MSMEHGAVSDIWDATMASWRRDLAQRRSAAERRLASLKHQESDFAEDHRRLLRMYDVMQRAVDEA
jgi:hypothetical protein